MITAVYIALGLIVLGVLINLVWRRISHYQATPCPSWLSWMVEMDNPFTRVSHAQFIIDHLGLDPDMKVLDAGCGPGRVTLPLAEAVGPRGEVVAVDIQNEMLVRVRTKAEMAGLANIRYLQAELGQGDLPLGIFNRAVLVSVLGEVPHQTKALKEIHDALQPGGILSITEVVFDPHFQGCEKMRRLIVNAGFTEEAFYGKRLAYTMHVKKPDKIALKKTKRCN